jgi:UDP-3-O-[3-hydroxymyristoyl] N-acetylglucosamine deacetylase
MPSGLQTTLSRPVALKGAGVHSNVSATLILRPAAANTGVVFLRKGLPGGRERLIEARWNKVSMTELCTVVGRPNDASVSTIEHLLSAFAGLGVDNALVEIDGPEVPIMDGSAAAFVEAIDEAGLVRLSAPRRFIKVLKPARVQRDDAYSELRPGGRGFGLDVEIDFGAGVIGRQRKRVELTPDVYRREIARARTFGFLRDVERLAKMGLALGATLDNTVALDDDRVLNPEGLRFADEFVRHKTLDAIGDLALAGMPILGQYRSFRGGHKMNVAVLEALFADRSAYVIVEAETSREGRRLEAARGFQPAVAAYVEAG